MASSEDRSAMKYSGRRLMRLMVERADDEQWKGFLAFPLEHALADGDADFANSLLKAGANGGAGSGWKGRDGRTLLDAAAEGGNEKAVGAVLEAGGSADLNAVSGSNSMTALHRASMGGHDAAVKKLLLQGAKVSLVDTQQRSALHCALENGHVSVAELVLVAGADAKASMRGGDTPLHLAAARGLSPFVSTLLNRGVGVDVTNDKRQTALHLALGAGHILTSEVLLKKGANPNLRFEGHVRDSLSFFCTRVHVGMTKMLLKHGADVKAVDQIGFTALHWAAECGQVSVVDTLIEAGADVEARSALCTIHSELHKGVTPLSVAAANCRASVMEALLRKGASINTKDDNGLTPLHVVCKISKAISAGAAGAADFLLRRGADETIRDNDGNTPGDLIENHVELQQLLENAPADRTWRRRGILVLCRAYLAKARGGVGRCKAARNEAGASAFGEVGSVLHGLMELEVEQLFRDIVKYL